jgi:hypothetical protein
MRAAQPNRPETLKWSFQLLAEGGLAIEALTKVCRLGSETFRERIKVAPRSSCVPRHG